jgi:hypothetical protein
MNLESYITLATLAIKAAGAACILGIIIYVGRRLVKYGEINAEKKAADMEAKAFIDTKKENEKFNALPADERRKLFNSKLVRKDSK